MTPFYTNYWKKRSNCNCECECHVGEYLDYKNCKCKKKLVDKLVKECRENIGRNDL